MCRLSNLLGRARRGRPVAEDERKAYWLNMDSAMVVLHTDKCSSVRRDGSAKWVGFATKEEARSSTGRRIHECFYCKP